MVPGTSPLVSSGASVLWSQITIGDMQNPATLTHPTMVTWDLLPDPTAAAALPLSTTTFGVLGLKGMQLSSCWITGQVCSAIYLHPRFPVINQMVWSHIRIGCFSMGQWQWCSCTKGEVGMAMRDSYQPPLLVFVAPFAISMHCTIAMTSFCDFA